MSANSKAGEAQHKKRYLIIDSYFLNSYVQKKYERENKKGLTRIMEDCTND